MDNYVAFCSKCGKATKHYSKYISRMKGVKLSCLVCNTCKTRFTKNPIKYQEEQKMKFKEALQRAKAITKKDFIDETIAKSKAKTTSKYDEARKWQPCKFKNCLGYSLSGTPPKAYLMITQGKIFCKRTLSEDAFKVINFEEEPKGSPSVSQEVEI